MRAVFRASVTEEGTLLFENRHAYWQHLDTLRGKPVEVIVRRVRSQRSSQANAYYWGVVVPLLAEELGYDRAEMHEVLAMHLLRIEDCPITGAPRRKRTPDCDTGEFASYVDSCIRLAADHGVFIPPPNDAAAVRVEP